MSMYSYCMFMYLHRASWHSSATLTEVFPCFFLSCKANARVKPAKTGHGPQSSKFLLFYVLFVLCRSVYCLCVNVYRTAATGWLPNCSQQIYLIWYCGYDSASLFIRFIRTWKTISLLCFTGKETTYDQWHLKCSSMFKSMVTATTRCRLIFNWYTSPCYSAKWPAIAINLTTSQLSPREPVRDTRPCHGVAKGLEYSYGHFVRHFTSAVGIRNQGQLAGCLVTATEGFSPNTHVWSSRYLSVTLTR
jgi:hypothetical protein